MEPDSGKGGDIDGQGNNSTKKDGDDINENE